MWDEEDGFFYDVLRLPDGSAHAARRCARWSGCCRCARSTVYAGGRSLTKLPRLRRTGALRFDRHRPSCWQNIDPPGRAGVQGRRHARRCSTRRSCAASWRACSTRTEFLSHYGIRSLSRYHPDHPYVFRVGGQEYRVGYLPAESDTGMFGGNSNWRGPVWLPVNVLLVRALLQLYTLLRRRLHGRVPDRLGPADDALRGGPGARRAGSSAIFLRDAQGRRPVYGGTEKFQDDPHWRDHILFYEYFHGDNGAGIGASHQTGWTGLVAALISIFGDTTAQQFLDERGAGFDRLARIHEAGDAAATTGA